MRTKKILIAAGGTGGHLFPAQQLAEMVKGEAEILFAGHKIGESPFFEKEKIPYADITAHPLKKGFIFAAWKGFWQAVKMIRCFSPDLVVGFGSYHTFPVLLAAAVLRKKLLLFEANCLLGKVNKLFYLAAHKIAFQFPLNLKKGILVPWLPWKEPGPLPLKAEARKSYGLDPNRKTVLVFGGSQGAAFLNENAPSAIASLKETQVIHLTGKGGEEAVRSAYAKRNIEACVKPFETDMAIAYRAADLALCRSGAGTIAELIRFEVPALLIPYPYAAEDHQRKNGIYLAEKMGGARMILQAEASQDLLKRELTMLIEEAEMLRSCLRAARSEEAERTHLAEIVKRM